MAPGVCQSVGGRGVCRRLLLIALAGPWKADHQGFALAGYVKLGPEQGFPAILRLHYSVTIVKCLRYVFRIVGHEVSKLAGRPIVLLQVCSGKLLVKEFVMAARNFR